MGKKNTLISILSFIVLATAGIVYLFIPKGASAPFIMPGNQTPPIVTPQPTPAHAPIPVKPTPKPTPQANNIPEGWKTYRNEELGFELQYPKEWFLYDEARWDEDDKIKSCNTVGVSAQGMLVLSKRELGMCIGSGANEKQLGDFAIYVYENNSSENDLLRDALLVEDKDTIKILEINGVKAVSSYYSAKSPLPRNKAIKNSINYEGKHYLIEFPQLDEKGSYDSIFGQILSTIKFLR